MMAIEHYYYVYSAMTQATGALVALVGIFIVFRIQLQKESIRKLEDSLIKRLFMRDVPAVEEDIDRGYGEKKGRGEVNEGTEQIYKERQADKDILQYTKEYGKVVITYTSFLFIYYILLLYMHIFLPISMLQEIFFVSSVFLSVVVVCGVILFLRNSIEPEDHNKYFGWLFRLLYVKKLHNYKGAASNF